MKTNDADTDDDESNENDTAIEPLTANDNIIIPGLDTDNNNIPCFFYCLLDCFMVKTGSGM